MPKRLPKWKVIFLHRPDPLFLYDFKAAMWCTRIRDKETYDLYYPLDGEWIITYSHRPANYCACGKEYNGFKFRDSFMNNPETLEDQIKWFQLPVLCMSCYYRKENSRGNWIPRKVRRELGLEE